MREKGYYWEGQLKSGFSNQEKTATPFQPGFKPGPSANAADDLPLELLGLALHPASLEDAFNQDHLCLSLHISLQGVIGDFLLPFLDPLRFPTPL